MHFLHGSASDLLDSRLGNGVISALKLGQSISVRSHVSRFFRTELRRVGAQGPL